MEDSAKDGLTQIVENVTVIPYGLGEFKTCASNVYDYGIGIHIKLHVRTLHKYKKLTFEF